MDSLGYVHDLRFRELVSKGENETIKANVNAVIKLTKTVGEFCGKLASIKEQTATNLFGLVDVFRKKTNEIKKRPECQSKTFLDAWDTILSEVENEAKDLTELGQQLQRCVANPLMSSATRKKNFCKKSFAYREQCQMQIIKSEEELNKKHKDYSEAWYKFNTHERETLKDHHIAVYHNGHNSFLLQLANVNSMNETLYTYTVPDILDDIEKVHKDISNSLFKYLKQFLGIQKSTLSKLMTRMDNAVESAKKIDVETDISNFVKYVDQTMYDRSTPFKQFFQPKATKEFKFDTENKQLTYLNKSLVVDQFTEPMLKRTAAYSRKRIIDLELSMQKLNSQIGTSFGLLESDSDSTEPSVDETDLLQKRNDVRDQRCQLHTFKAQMTLFSPDILERLGPIPDEYASETGKQPITIGRPNDTSMRTTNEKPHKFIEHNFLKPAQCHYCKGIIVGLVKQGLKCQKCRMNVHKKCKANVAFCTGSIVVPATPQSKQRPSVSSMPSMDETSSQDIPLEDDDLYAYIDPEDVMSTRPIPHNQRSTSFDDANYESPEPVQLTRPLPPTGAVNGSMLNRALPETPQDLPWCVALFDFDGEESHDLRLEAGDKIQIIAKSSDEWWEGLCKGKKGYFPSSYAEKIEENDVILRILYTFEAEADGDELPVEEGQIIVLVEDEGNGWTVGKAHGKTGAFPSSYAERL